MIKRCYWDVKHFDEGLQWFGLTLCGAPTGTILDAAYVVWQLLISQTQISRSATQMMLAVYGTIISCQNAIYCSGPSHLWTQSHRMVQATLRMRAKH
jgi:hypothetical protein